MTGVIDRTRTDDDAPVTGGGRTRRAGGDLRADLVLLLGLALTRIVYYQHGTYFDTSFLQTGWQLPDYELLTHHLLTSAWYFHSQPPLFVLLVGLVLWISPWHDGATFQVVWLLFTVLVGLGVRRVLVLLRVPAWAAVVGALVVLCTPQQLWMESRPIYDLPVTAGVVWLVVKAARYVESGRLRHLAATLAIATALTLSRSLFDPVLLVLLAVVVLVARRPRPGTRRWQLGLVLAVPVVLVGGLMVKNQVLFGAPQLSSWTGPSLTKIVQAGQPLDQIQRDYVDKDITSPLFSVHAYAPLDYHAGLVDPCKRKYPAVQVLNQPHKQTELGTTNFNDECFLPIYRQERTDAINAVRAYPGRYLVNVGRAMRFFFADVAVSGPDHGGEQGSQHVYDAVGVGVTLHTPLYGTLDLVTVEVRVLLLLVAGLALLAIRGASQLRQWRRRALDPNGATWLVAALLSMWILLVGCALEIPENQRFRSYIDPLLYATLLATVTGACRLAARLVRPARGRHGRRRGPRPPAPVAADAP